MMRTKIIVAAMLVAQPAHAACHKYSRWYYPWPQRCPVAYARGEDPPRLIPEVFPPIKPDEEIEVTIPSVKQETTPTPLMMIPELNPWDVDAHDAATMKLRLIQQGKWKDQ
jgi:hypothetical protein